jgi:hypothetical protein
MIYSDFLEQKAILDTPSGFRVDLADLNIHLFDWQKVLVRWGLLRGRAALFEGTGLGKTLQQLEWANRVMQHTNRPVLLLAPLAVGEQSKKEGEKFGIASQTAGSSADIKGAGIYITNYEKLHRFDMSVFTGVVWDESSILKSFTGTTRNQIIQAFRNTPYRLACSATPSPNDWPELGNHAEALSILTYSEMRSTFFINDTKNTGAPWRLKGHVQENIFWKWFASWAAVIGMPSDLGFSDEGFVLPPITYHEHIIPAQKGAKRRGFFLEEVGDQNSRRAVRRDTMDLRCQAAADLINSDPHTTWLIWCGLNPEGELLTELVDGAVEVAGRHKDEYKKEVLLNFAEGKIDRLVTKPDIAGWGMNFQTCHKAAFVGLNDSWESLFQAVRRIWRFGQKEPCEIHIFVEEREGPVLRNIKRKDAQAKEMGISMLKHMRDLVRKEVIQSKREQDAYAPVLIMEVPKWI